MLRDLPLVLRIAGVWLMFSVWAIISGWSLSWFRLLDSVYYTYSSLIFFISAAWWWISTKSRRYAAKPFFGGLRKKTTNPARFAWTLVVFLILLAASIHPPANHDAVTYRMPRLYYWLQEHGWHWIGGLDYRMDIAGTGFEWMSVPLVLLTGNDRLLFLLNFIPFLLLPGLSFLAGRGVGLNARESRWWMWVWPLAFGVAMQAGSIGNDFPGLAYSLAALAFARAADRWSPSICMGFSAIAIVLMTGVKITALPLTLPLAIYWLYQAWRLLPLGKLLRISIILSPVILLCGLLPISFLCWKHTGKWNGNPDNRLGIEVKKPLAGLMGNGLNMVAATAYPPVFPKAGPIGKNLTDWLGSREWHDWVREGNPSYTINLNQELPSEELAGIGIAVTSLVAVWVLGSFRRNSRLVPPRPILARLYAVATFLALCVFLAKVSSGTTARLALAFTPHLVFSVALLLRPRLRVPHQAWTIVPALFILPTLLLNPNRPLVSANFMKSLPFLPSGITKRMEVVYATYSNRNHLLAPLADLIPDGDTAAFAGGTDHPSSALFQPLHRIRVLDLNSSNIDNAEWIVGTEDGIKQRLSLSLPECRQLGYELVASMSITDKVVVGPENWHLLHKASVTR